MKESKYLKYYKTDKYYRKGRVKRLKQRREKKREILVRIWIFRMKAKLKKKE